MECNWDDIMQRSGLIGELRNANRYRLNVPVVFWWPEVDDMSERGEGITTDISSAGVFVLTTSLPPIGARIELDVLVPGIRDGSPGVRLNGDGFLLRLQHGPAGPVGFAASVQFYPENPDLEAVYRCRGPGSLLEYPGNLVQ